LTTPSSRSRLGRERFQDLPMSSINASPVDQMRICQGARFRRLLCSNRTKTDNETSADSWILQDTHECILIRTVHRSTFPRHAAHTARAETARSTPSTRSPNTRLARYATIKMCKARITFSQAMTGLSFRTRKETLRPQAIRLRRSDKACFPQEGQDDQESRAETGVHTMQDQGTAVAQALQALRAWVRFTGR
jgi:hypothetical protein